VEISNRYAHVLEEVRVELDVKPATFICIVEEILTELVAEDLLVDFRQQRMPEIHEIGMPVDPDGDAINLVLPRT
jgi:hypothetical protein